MKGLFAREIISCAKLHIFRQIALIYTKKVMRESDLFSICLVAIWIVEQITLCQF